MIIKKLLKEKCLKCKTFNKFYKLSKKNNIQFYNDYNIYSFKKVSDIINNKKSELINNFKSKVNNFNSKDDILSKIKLEINNLEDNIKSLNKNQSLLNILSENNMYNIKSKRIYQRINYSNIFTNQINKENINQEKFSNKEKYLAEYSNS